MIDQVSLASNAVAVANGQRPSHRVELDARSDRHQLLVGSQRQDLIGASHRLQRHSQIETCSRLGFRQLRRSVPEMRWAASFPERVGRFTWEEDERAAYLLVGLRYDGHLFFPANRWHRLCLICSLFSGCIVKCSLDEPAKSFVAVIVFHWRSQRHQRTRTAVHQRGAHRLGRHEGIQRQPLGILRWRR